MEPCRKCATPNPVTNQYCRACGAVLNVSTTMMRAQRTIGKIVPAAKTVRWQWVALGLLSHLGTIAVLFFVLFIVALLSTDLQRANAVPTSWATTLTHFLGIAIAAITLFLMAFGLSAVLLRFVARVNVLYESMIAAFILMVLAAVMGSLVTVDAAIVMGVLAVPSVLLAGLGAWLGQLVKGGTGK